MEPTLRLNLKSLILLTAQVRPTRSLLPFSGIHRYGSHIQP